MSKKLTLAIDFDNTIVEEKYPDIGNLLPGAKKYINKLYEQGYYIIINTCRANDQELEAEDYLYRKGISFHRLNENQPSRILQYGTDCRKISADIYIDDKNLGNLPDWKTIYKLIRQKTNELSTERILTETS